MTHLFIHKVHSRAGGSSADVTALTGVKRRQAAVTSHVTRCLFPLICDQQAAVGQLKKTLLALLKRPVDSLSV